MAVTVGCGLLTGAEQTMSLDSLDSTPFPGTGTDPWTSYFGIQDRSAAWAKVRRGIVRNNSGWALVEGTRVGTASYQERLQKLSELIEPASREADLILPVGAVLSGRNEEQFLAFAKMIDADQGKMWKTIVKDQAHAASSAAAAGHALYWQIDNEINSRHMVSSAATLEGWGDVDQFDDTRLIEVYAEYILAPTIEALKEVRQAEGVNPAHVQIMLGSVANTTRESSEQWLNDLVGYRFDGRYAPSLRGSRVADHIDVISVHYVGTRDERLEDGVLARTFDRWVGVGAVRGVWATEELGKARAQKGLGALTAMRVMAGYIHWVNERSLNSKQVSCSFWGATAGDPTAVQGLNLLYDYLGDTVLRNASDDVKVTGVTRVARTYSFLTADMSKRAVLIVSEDRDRSNAVRSIEIDDGATLSDVRIFDVSADGLAPLSHRVEGQQIVLDQRVKIGPGRGVLALLTRHTADKKE